MLLYMQGYVKFLVTLGAKHFNNSLVKHRFPCQGSIIIHVVFNLCFLRDFYQC